MHKQVFLALLAWCSVAAASLARAQAVPAFSGAAGPGATATGGRGGDVYHVTNLEFDVSGAIPGSLKYGINTAPAAGRTIVFDVGGTIHNAKVNLNAADIFASGKSNITIAGQTAPGPGITISGVGSKWSGNNVILRNITVRPNIGVRTDGRSPQTYDAFSLQLKNSVVDHVSASWYTDEGISLTDAGENTTVQYAYMNEGLNYNSHGYGSIIATEFDATQYSYHHNLYAHNNSRLPRLGSEIGATGAVLNFSNNVVYNWINRAGYSGTNQHSRSNFINNYYIKGNNNGATVFTGGDADGAPGYTQIYQNGQNKYDGDKDGVHDGVAFGSSSFAGNKTFVATPFNVTGVAAPDSTDLALQRVLDYGGANWQNRNPVEQRIVASVRNGTGGVITAVPTSDWDVVMAQQPTGGVAPFNRAADWDLDNDGMPDFWEMAYGLNPAAADNNGDIDADGYTNLEEYINEIAAWPAAAPIVFNGATSNRYAQIANWDGKWQPSRFDAAHVRSGTAVVDAIGQHAGTLAVAPVAGDDATLNVTAGWIDVAAALNVGPAGTGVVNHTGGAVAAQSINLGGSGAASGTYNLSGAGVLRVMTLAKGSVGGVFNFTGGTLSADVIAFDLVNDGGTISPGDSPGATYVQGDLSITDGNLLLEIAGSAPGEFDTLQIDGALTAGGALTVSLLNGYAPSAGAAFDLLDFTTATGDFTLSLPALDPGLAWNTSALLTSGVISIDSTPIYSADFNHDGEVDSDDLAVWAAHFGDLDQPDNGAGDATGDGAVDGADLLAWQQQLDLSAATAAGAIVPEPTAITLILCGALLLRLTAWAY